MKANRDGALKLPPQPMQVRVGSMVWCLAANSYDQRSFQGWHPFHGAHGMEWHARVNGRHVTIPACDVFVSREDCHRELVARLEAIYDRQVARLRKMRHRLDGLRNTADETDMHATLRTKSKK